MYAFRIGDLEQVMKIPVPMRKWLIQRWNKQKEKEAGIKPQPDTPINQINKFNFSKQNQSNPSSALQPVRNIK